jgi:hypothetical protein
MYLLLTAMGIVGDLKPKLGGGKPRCLGSAQVTLRQGQFWTPQAAALTYERSVATLSSEQLCQQVVGSKELVQPQALDSLKKILSHPRNEECPPEIY